MKRAIVSVISDLSSDRRVHRTCLTLSKLGFDVLLIGRRRRKSLILEPRTYKTKRIFLLFEKGFLLYAEYNLRLFFILLFKQCDLLVANDLDTLLPNYLIKKLRGKNLVYDSHEYFLGVPELEGRRFVKSTWRCIEKKIFPGITDVITVNDSIAELYKKDYNKELTVVRNITDRQKVEIKKSKRELGLTEDKVIIVLQGTGINIDRGAEEAVQSMQYVNNAILYIIGDGDVITLLKKMVNEMQLTDNVVFIPKQPLEVLFQYTVHADIGLTLDKDTNINYRYSLPNKLFDYIHAEVPILASALPEVKKIIQQFDVGELIENHNPEHIAAKINKLIVDKHRRDVMKENCIIAKKYLNWEVEENNLVNVFKRYI